MMSRRALGPADGAARARRRHGLRGRGDRRARRAAPSSLASGEVVFNTAMSGYQEIITDPSYAGQVICFTYPHIGSYGVTPRDAESRRPFCRGVIVRDLVELPSSWRAEEALESFLVRHGIGGLTGVDTRRLTRHVREAGAMPCAFGTALRPTCSRRPGASREPPASTSSAR